jgi:predicted TIM-barrel fold metal-dependent hydrolase
MGFIDSDAHVRENDDTWSHLEPRERQYRPVTMRSEGGDEWWVCTNQRVTRRDRNMGLTPDLLDSYLSIYPPGAADLTDPARRVKHMDELGIDVQVLISSFFITGFFERPIVEAALARSYNRWMAERTQDSGGRLRWALIAPVRMMDRALEELEFGAANGAVCVHVNNPLAGMVVDDEYFDPLYATAQDLGLAICVHVGLDSRVAHRDHRGLFQMVTNVVCAFQRLATGNLSERFPRLRWGFLEAGASWVPFVLKEAARSDESLVRRADASTVIDPDVMARRNLYVACQIDDDIDYLLRFAGNGNLVVGTDYSHFDVGSDVDACRIVAERADVDPVARQHVADLNGRALFGIAPAFRPVPDASPVGV